MVSPDRLKAISIKEIHSLKPQITEVFQWAFGEREFLGEYLNLLLPQTTAVGFQPAEGELTLIQERRLFTVIKNAFPLLWQVYNGQTRLVSDRLYLAHVLKTAFFVHQLIADNDFDDPTYKRFILAALFHDGFEMNEDFATNPEEFVSKLKQSLPNHEENWYARVKEDIIFLTPQDKDPFQSYFEQKQADFERFLNTEDSLNKKIRLVVKTADVWANLWETAEDLQTCREDGQMKHTPVERYNVFAARVARLRKALTDGVFNRLDIQRIEEAISEMEGLLKAHTSLISGSS
jgi:hypothetical protein